MPVTLKLIAKLPIAAKIKVRMEDGGKVKKVFVDGQFDGIVERVKDHEFLWRNRNHKEGKAESEQAAFMKLGFKVAS